MKKVMQHFFDQDISKGDGRTVLFVSHNMAAVKNLCTRGLVLKHGKIVFNGGVEEAINKFTVSDAQTKERFAKLESTKPILEVRNLKTWFPTKTNFFGKPTEWVKAVNDVSFDVYEGDKLPKGKKSYALSFLFQDEERTLVDTQIDKIMHKIVAVLTKEFDAQLR